MKNYKLLFGLMLLAFSLGSQSCDKTKMVLIRIENATGHAITDIFVSAPEDDHHYGSLGNGATSDYKAYEKAYRYAFCTFRIDGDEFTIQPIDYVGESLLEPGKYTYRLTISDLESPWAGMELGD